MTLPYSVGSHLPLTASESAYLGAKAALALLPDDQGGVADALRARGVRGAVGHHARSPLAMYLTGRTGYVWIVEAERALCYLRHDVIDVPLPSSVRAFVRSWTDGAYSDLIGDATSGSVGPVSIEQMREAWRGAA